MNYTSPTQNVLRVVRVHENRAVKGARLLKQDVQKLNFSTNDDYAQSCLFSKAKTIFSREITLFFKVESQSFSKFFQSGGTINQRGVNSGVMGIWCH